MNKEITPMKVALDYHSGKISKSFAIKVLVKLFGYSEKQAEEYLII